MDLEKLAQSYERDLGKQVRWLQKNGFPQGSIDYAISAVYKRIELGETFPGGHELDQELRKVAKTHFESDIAEQLKKRLAQVEANLDVEWNKLTKWQKIKEVIRGRA